MLLASNLLEFFYNNQYPQDNDLIILKICYSNDNRLGNGTFISSSLRFTSAPPIT